jgi:hypothetical protein
MKLTRKNGATSVILRGIIRDTTQTDGRGLTGLTSASSGLKISAIADVEATTTTYTGANLESITTLGTYAAPTAGKARFKEVDATNHPGLYEIQLADARFAVSNAKSLIVSINGATNAGQLDMEIELTAFDNQDGVRAGLTALPNAAAGATGGLATVDSSNAVKVQSGTGANQISLTSGLVTLAAVTHTGATIPTVTSVTTGVDLTSRETVVMHSGTAQAGAAGSITLAAGASATTDYYKGSLLKISTGTGAGQSRTITAYDGSTKIATVAWNWIVNPDATSVYQVCAAGNPSLNSSLQVATTASDPWATALPGAYGAGTAGNIIGNRLDAAVTTRLAPTVATRTLDVTSNGNAGIDWNNVEAPTTSVNLSATTIGTATSVTNGVPLAGVETAVLHSGTAQAGATSTITLASGASSVDDFYNKKVVRIYSSTGAGQSRTIVDYVGSTRVATVDRPWATNPSSSSLYAVVSDDHPSLDNGTATYDRTTDSLQALRDSSATIADVADGIWDEPISGHLTAGTVGEKLNSAASAGDPWSTALPGSYGAGTAGNIVGNRIDAAVTSRLAPTTPGNTLDVSAAGNAGIDWANVAGPTTSVALSGTSIGSVTGAIGSVGTGGIVAASFAAGAIDAAAIGTGAIDADALAASADNEIADAFLDRTDAIETGLTPRGALRLISSEAAGKLSGAESGSTTVTIRNAVQDSKPRITATVDADGNRTAITWDAT